MKVLGIETSCDECAAAVVEKGRDVLSNVILTQIDFHRPYYGVVPEIASRKHIEWIYQVVSTALDEAGMEIEDMDAIAVTYRPGLIGSLLVGLSFAKAMAFSLDIPFIGIDHILAHMYAAHLEADIEYPYLGLIVSGGHTILAVVKDYDKIEVLGTTIDDACGEAFDKVAKYYQLGFPGGAAIDRLARRGNSGAFRFPKPSLHKGDHRYDFSYSGLKTAVINQLDQFWNRKYPKTRENIAASFEKTAIDIILERVSRAVKDTGIERVVAGGGVVANSYLRGSLKSMFGDQVILPSMKFCTDNGAMVAGIGYHYIVNNRRSTLELNAEARVPDFRKTYP